jgi:hypothetical protein
VNAMTTRVLSGYPATALTTELTPDHLYRIG